jgi:hypothetical protein
MSITTAFGNHPASTGIAEKYFLHPNICMDEQGLDCSELTLGDNYLSTSSPAKGKLYSCIPKNASAPGSRLERITWIDFTNNKWNLFAKLWLPEGNFQTSEGIYSEIMNEDLRSIEINNAPKDGRIGDWPMTDHPVLTTIDANPGVPSAKRMEFNLPRKPVWDESPGCLSPGAIGITKNGVVLYSASDARGNDALAHEIVDIYGGHPARDEYHYHFIPERLDDQREVNGHSVVVGWIRDGFPIHGYYGIGGKEMTNEDLDECHGHQHESIGYHYHSTLEYPYSVGCYRGKIRQIASGNSDQRRSRNAQPPKNSSGVNHLQKIAKDLNLGVEELRRAVGPPPPNLKRAARILKVDEAQLRKLFKKYR